MANIQEDVSRQIFDLFLKFFGTGSEFVYQITHEGNVALKQGYNFTSELLLALINKNKEAGEPTDSLAQMLKREEKGESVNSMAVAEEHAQELQKRLEDKKILYHVIDSQTDDSKFIMYMSNDAEKVADIVSVFHAEKGLVLEINPDLFLDNYANESIGTISGLDAVDLELFRGYARRNNLIFSSTLTEDEGKYMIIYDPKDTKTVRKTMGMALWAISGEDGALYRKQMVSFINNKRKLSRALLEPEKEYYIVNAQNPEQYVHLTANDLTYFKYSKEVLAVSRKDRDYLERGKRVLDGMDMPILLTREEYERFKENGELDKESIKKTLEIRGSKET